MPKREVLPIIWTDRAAYHTILIKKYLISNFTNKEVEHFYSLLQAFEITVCTFPDIYPKSAVRKNIRRAVISKLVSVYYRKRKTKIEVVAILDNRCDIDKWF